MTSLSSASWLRGLRSSMETGVCLSFPAEYGTNMGLEVLFLTYERIRVHTQQLSFAPNMNTTRYRSWFSFLSCFGAAGWGWCCKNMPGASFKHSAIIVTSRTRISVIPQSIAGARKESRYFPAIPTTSRDLAQSTYQDLVVDHRDTNDRPSERVCFCCIVALQKKKACTCYADLPQVYSPRRH